MVQISILNRNLLIESKEESIGKFTQTFRYSLIIHTGTKEEIIQFFINQNNIDKTIITTIGDELDDLNMLKLYNGYRMEQCNEKVRQNIKKSVKSVAELINFII